MASVFADISPCRVCGEHKPRDAAHFVTCKGKITPRCRACHRRLSIEYKRMQLADPKLRKVRLRNEKRYRKSAKGRETAKRHRTAAHHKYRQKKAGRDLPFVWSHDEWQRTLDRFEHACVYCGAGDVALHQDHFIPLSAADCPGTVPHNMVPSCVRCNSRKRDRRAEDVYGQEVIGPIADMLSRAGAHVLVDVPF